MTARWLFFLSNLNMGGGGTPTPPLGGGSINKDVRIGYEPTTLSGGGSISIGGVE